MTSPDVSIVVPTFNERENLPALITRLDDALTDAGYDYEVVVVDDDSPDNTWQVAQELGEEYPVTVVRRVNESGLGTAVVRGFAVATASRIVVMDADLQHPPETVPDLLKALDETVQLAIGSRYVAGGSPGEFSLSRRLISRGANLVARLAFPETRGIRDLQSGFFALRRALIEDADLAPRGYKILIDIVIRCEPDAVEEVGFEFQQRAAGESNLSVSTVLNYFRHLGEVATASGRLGQFLRFCVVGLLGTIVNLVIFSELIQMDVFYLFAGALAAEISVLTNFSLNAAWTFRREHNGLSTALVNAFLKDHIVRSGGLLLTIGMLFLLTTIGIPALFAQAVGIVAAIFWNFAGNIHMVWYDA